MNIVIVGAGGVGRYSASVLSKKGHNVFLIDPDPRQLDKASWQSDVGTKPGSGTDWQLLDDLLELSPDLLIALTSNDEVNFTSCAIAKHLGYPRTIARVRDNRFLNRTRLDFSHIFAVDYFLCPELLVANDIIKYLTSPGSLAVEHFAHGAVQLRELAIPEKWKKAEVSLSDLDLPEGVMVGLIRREVDQERKIIFPHGKDCILPGDEVTFIGNAEIVSSLHGYLGIQEKPVRSAVIVGGSATGLNLARLLQDQHIDVRVIEKDFKQCRLLAEQLPDCTIIHHDGTDIDFLMAEKINTADLFVPCTNKDEVNLAAGALAKEMGVEHVIAPLSNLGYRNLADKLGIGHTVSSRLSSADHILSQMLSETVSSLVTFYDNQVEIIEVHVAQDSKIVGIPLVELGPLLPRDFLIVIIENRGRVMVANGNRIISPGDNVIVITSPKHIPELNTIF